MPAALVGRTFGGRPPPVKVAVPGGTVGGAGPVTVSLTAVSASNRAAGIAAVTRGTCGPSVDTAAIEIVVDAWAGETA